MFPTSRAARRATLALAAFAALPACSMRRTDVCGEVPASGGPAVVVSRDQELCEITRTRVQRILADDMKLDELTTQHLHSKSFSWEDAKTTDGLVARIRSDAGDAYADAVARAIADVRQFSTRPLKPDCPVEDRCLALGAARGARFAVGDALDYFIRTRPPMFRPGDDGALDR
jgi:hypothetical protein